MDTLPVLRANTLRVEGPRFIEPITAIVEGILEDGLALR